MQIYHGLPELPLARPSALTIGNFDGVHLGHRALIHTMLESARRRGWQGGVLTFHPHPAAVLRPHTNQLYLTTMDERLELLSGIGVDFTVVYPFTLATANLPAAEFVAQVARAVNLAGLWVGPDFALGRGREGNVEVLAALGRTMGFEVYVIEPQTIGGVEVRSGRIRQLLLEGDVAAAAEGLGWRYRVSGVVVPGASRGHRIGFPTANLAVAAERLLPANGVYATWAWIENGGDNGLQCYASVTNIGVRPSFDNGQRTVEAHLLDFSGNLYGRRMALEFVERLRPEMKFPGVDALRSQIQQDIARARAILRA
ncbi:MAG: bifunctional riboflavin kinase/FAD synthetase [Caldilineales bacterium]|nr:bifunctional riboflavin kinase/FAD synthetase [Caldilineales bacterium]MDW8319369.1 bifunctional riboflavin kinase/FAD synthetase [Anaerolineae bacterium]